MTAAALNPAYHGGGATDGHEPQAQLQGTVGGLGVAPAAEHDIGCHVCDVEEEGCGVGRWPSLDVAEGAELRVTASVPDDECRPQCAEADREGGGPTSAPRGSRRVRDADFADEGLGAEGGEYQCRAIDCVSKGLGTEGSFGSSVGSNWVRTLPSMTSEGR